MALLARPRTVSHLEVPRRPQPRAPSHSLPSGVHLGLQPWGMQGAQVRSHVPPGWGPWFCLSSCCAFCKQASGVLSLFRFSTVSSSSLPPTSSGSHSSKVIFCFFFFFFYSRSLLVIFFYFYFLELFTFCFIFYVNTLFTFFCFCLCWLSVLNTAVYNVHPKLPIYPSPPALPSW